MKGCDYEQKRFSVGSPGTKQYRDNYDRIDWGKAKAEPYKAPYRCATCQDTGLVLGPGEIFDCACALGRQRVYKAAYKKAENECHCGTPGWCVCGQRHETLAAAKRSSKGGVWQCSRCGFYVVGKAPQAELPPLCGECWNALGKDTTAG